MFFFSYVPYEENVFWNTLGNTIRGWIIKSYFKNELWNSDFPKILDIFFYTISREFF